ncbi:MAG: hypothetical protein JO121_01745 [Deltaproteobacteria bacterium]|jgi:hypothetical protein|nr:hypothetical protein [Deltaproteobacteria bacterium]
MDAALEQMLPLGQTGDIEMAALNDSRPGDRDVLEGALALWDHAGRGARIERRQESVAERFHLGEGMRFAALINNRNRRSLLDC